MKREPPKLDESIERDPVTVDEFAEVMRAVLNGGEPETKSKNREPTRAELAQRWKLERRR